MKMAIRIFIPVCLVIAAFITAQGQTTNMLPNGGFESGKPSLFTLDVNPSVEYTLKPWVDADAELVKRVVDWMYTGELALDLVSLDPAMNTALQTLLREAWLRSAG